MEFLSTKQFFEALHLGATPHSVSPQSVIKKICEPSSAEADAAVFLGSESMLKQCVRHEKAWYFVDKKLPLPPGWADESNVILVDDAKLLFARATQLFRREKVFKPGVSPRAEVSTSASLGDGVAIAAGAYVGERSKIGDGVTLYPGVYVGNDVTIGKDSVLFANVVIYDNAQIGQRVRIHAGSVVGADGFGYAQDFSPAGVEHVKIEHLGRVILGDDVEVGASSCIDRGTIGDTVIGRGTKIDNQVQIGHNCQIGESVIICGSSGLAGSVRVGKNSVVAGFVGVGNGADIGPGSTISGFTMVFGKVPPGSKWGGVPGRPLRESLKIQALMGKLPELFKAYKLERKDSE